MDINDNTIYIVWEKSVNNNINIFFKQLNLEGKDRIADKNGVYHIAIAILNRGFYSGIVEYSIYYLRTLGEISIPYDEQYLVKRWYKVRTSEPNFYDEGPHIAVDSQDGVHIVGVDMMEAYTKGKPGGDLMYAYKLYDGQEKFYTSTIFSPNPINREYLLKNINLIADSKGYLHAGLIDDSSWLKNYFTTYYFLFDNQANILDTQSNTINYNSFLDSSVFSIAVDHKDRAHVFYSDFYNLHNQIIKHDVYDNKNKVAQEIIRGFEYPPNTKLSFEVSTDKDDRLYINYVVGNEIHTIHTGSAILP